MNVTDIITATTITNVWVDRVATMAREKLLPAIRCGRSWRFAPAQLRKWMESGGAGGWKRAPKADRCRQ
jgi:excisionase family DNA binding protein